MNISLLLKEENSSVRCSIVVEAHLDLHPYQGSLKKEEDLIKFLQVRGGTHAGSSLSEEEKKEEEEVLGDFSS